jgi:DnaJ family protein C protein 7
VCHTPPPFILGHRFKAAVVAAENAAHVDPKNMEVMLKLQKARAVASARTLGNDLYKAGKMLEASVAYSEGLQYDPINAILLCNRAACRCDFASFLANLFLILVCLV